MYPTFKEQILNSTIIVPSTFKKYCTVQWHGKQINSSLSHNCKHLYVFAVPPFQFTTSIPSEFENKERLAEVNCFMIHSFVLPDCLEPKSHLLVSAKWPMIHPETPFWKVCWSVVHWCIWAWYKEHILFGISNLCKSNYLNWLHFFWVFVLLFLSVWALPWLKAISTALPAKQQRFFYSKIFL